MRGHPRLRSTVALGVTVLAMVFVSGCGGSTRTNEWVSARQPAATGTATPPPTAAGSSPPIVAPPMPRYGNPNGHATIPAAARPVDTSHPDHVIGTGTPSSCTSAALVRAVAAGGII